MEIFAHRGASYGAPENTMSAFFLALQEGADGIELDVHLTKDGEVVVLHDETVDRTTDGRGWVKDLTWAEIRTLDAGGRFSDAFRGERIPRLADVLSWIRTTPLKLNIELKNGWVPYPDLEARVVTLLRQYDLVDRAILSSFNHDSLRLLAERFPDVRRAALYVARLYQPWNYSAALGGADHHPFYLSVTPEMVAGVKAHGFQVRPFTVDEPEHIRALQAIGADAVITNRPAEARAALV